MVCPTCKLINPGNTQTCDCGYNFLTGLITAPVTPSIRPSMWSFDGRIGRGSFWGVCGGLLLANVVLGLAIAALRQAGDGGAMIALFLNIPCLVFGVWLSLATQVKRWHDLDKSGWMVMLNFTIIFIPIALIFLGCVRGKHGPNQYGSDPKFQQAQPATKMVPATMCGNCGESFPSGFYLERSANGRYLCEKCRGISHSAASA